MVLTPPTNQTSLDLKPRWCPLLCVWTKLRKQHQSLVVGTIGFHIIYLDHSTTLFLVFPPGMVDHDTLHDAYARAGFVLYPTAFPGG